MSEILAAVDRDGHDEFHALHNYPDDVSLHRTVVAVIQSRSPRVEASAPLTAGDRLGEAQVEVTKGEDSFVRSISRGSPLFRALRAWAEALTL
ncbi:MAG: hypothetical protein L0K12_15825 [Brevibacterium aurantiacum]|nr:hypothetical protein [Brevibacterium aurantiacum]